MALSGPTVATQQLITPTGWIREGTKRGSIEIKVHWEQSHDLFRTVGKLPGGSTFDAGLVFEADQSKQATLLKARDYRLNGTRTRTAERGPWHPDASGWMLGAYGPLRRLTGSSTEALRYALGHGKLACCVTLFREDAALSESEIWLRQEHARALEQRSQERPESNLVEQVQELLNDGLLPEGFKISRVSVDDVSVSTPNGGDLPMRDLSDGCRSAFALVLDIIHSMAVSYFGKALFERNKSGQLVVGKPGVVLIDEIEAHLHPSWQRLICEWLKSRFPNVQFFVTTHSPLIVQAADPGGVYVLPLPNELTSGRGVRHLSPHEQDRIALGNAEKVLLGEAFGLKNTWSERANRVVDEWQKLAAQRNATGNLPPDDQETFDKLTGQVKLVFDDDPEDALVNA